MSVACWYRWLLIAANSFFQKPSCSPGPWCQLLTIDEDRRPSFPRWKHPQGCQNWDLSESGELAGASDAVAVGT